ncbi:efflux RND transporter periplasmic adaptor subunit [Mariniblastus fucicola]|uniref:Multidrug resistance protein MdtA n=1 Tax=Mariniblastus fucicola TaxID=980251 RepID=A0A5B9PED6_9BACT|nr:efflux RND transporter periplasmic adaptor subunit [Mariniblastus fucicola]QEG22936.1 Multidrug resistance protein MdtA precursor [Mariniblastus fucicola]
MNSITSSSQREIALKNRFWTSLLSASLTAFLLGGIATYFGTGLLNPNAAANAGSPDKKPVKKSGPQAQLVRVGTIERKSITPERALIGDLVAVRRATIATEVAGKIIEFSVDEGSKVIGGETLLARIDNTWTKLNESKIASQIAEKKATLAFEMKDLLRYNELLRSSAVSSSEVELKRATIESLEASIGQLVVLQNEARERNARLEIYAPFDGSVVAKHAEVGEYVSVGSPVVEIVSSGRIDAQIMVPEDSLPFIAVDDAIDLIVDSLGLRIQGHVFSINAQGAMGSRTFPVRIQLDDQGGKLLPGMGVSAMVPMKKESTEILVPRDAVLMKPDESNVWILESATSAEIGDPNSNADNQETKTVWQARPVPVHVLSHTRDSYAIACARESDVERLTPGVQVVTEGLERLIPGATVRIDPDRSPLKAVPGAYRTGQQVSGR